MTPAFPGVWLQTPAPSQASWVQMAVSASQAVPAGRAAHRRLQQTSLAGGVPGSQASPASTLPFPHRAERRVPVTDQGGMLHPPSAQAREPVSVPSAATAPDSVNTCDIGGEVKMTRTPPTVKAPVAGSIEPMNGLRSPALNDTMALRVVPCCAKTASAVALGVPVSVSAHDPLASTSARAADGGR